MMSDAATLRRLDAAEKRIGQVYDQIACTYVPITTALTEAGGGLVGGALVVGTYSFGPAGGGATYSFAYPTTAKALNVMLSGQWAAAASATYAYCRPNGGSVIEAACLARSMVAGFYNSSAGTVALDGSGLGQLVVVGANATGLSLYVLGWYL